MLSLIHNYNLKDNIMHDNAISLLENRTILYAEDEAGIRENVVQILEIFFKKVYVANDGESALLLYEENFPDILMVDICMPNKDGLEVISHIRKKNSKIPIIVLSAHRDGAHLWRAVEQKISKYLTKPFNKTEIMEALSICALELVDGILHVKLNENVDYDISQKSLISNGDKIPLSSQESRLLEYFISCRGQILSFEAIEDRLWGYESPGKEAIKALVKALRKKTGKEVIKNHYGIGYYLA